MKKPRLDGFNEYGTTTLFRFSSHLLLELIHTLNLASRQPNEGLVQWKWNLTPYVIDAWKENRLYGIRVIQDSLMTHGSDDGDNELNHNVFMNPNEEQSIHKSHVFRWDNVLPCFCILSSQFPQVVELVWVDKKAGHLSCIETILRLLNVYYISDGIPDWCEDIQGFANK